MLVVSQAGRAVSKAPYKRRLLRPQSSRSLCARWTSSALPASSSSTTSSGTTGRSGGGSPSISWHSVSFQDTHAENWIMKAVNVALVPSKAGGLDDVP